MSTAHDIYDPPPAPIAFVPPRPDRVRWQVGDLICLVALSAPLFAATAWAWSVESALAPLVLVGGLFVLVESWFSALTFLQRHPKTKLGGRGMIFLAALVPWLICLGFAAALMLGLFLASDWAG